jgi:hypothetical protein
MLFQSVIFLPEGFLCGLQFLFQTLLFGCEFLQSLLGRFEGILQRLIFFSEILNNCFERGLDGVVLPSQGLNVGFEGIVFLLQSHLIVSQFLNLILLVFQSFLHFHKSLPLLIFFAFS